MGAGGTEREWGRIATAGCWSLKAAFGLEYEHYSGCWLAAVQPDDAEALLWLVLAVGVSLACDASQLR